MKDGHKLFITAHYAFNYDEGHYDHLMQFDILTQFFEHRNGLEGYIDDEDGPRVEEFSEVDTLMQRLYKGFDSRDVPRVVKQLLLEYEMYEILAEYDSPLEGEAILYREQLTTGNYEN